MIDQKQLDIFIRRWALNCAVASYFHGSGLGEHIIERARLFERYLRDG